MSAIIYYSWEIVDFASGAILFFVTTSYLENGAWWRHQMETFSALLAICAGNSPVTGEFPAQRQVTRSFDVFFVLRLNKRLSKRSWCWWFETPSRPLWCHCNVGIAEPMIPDSSTASKKIFDITLNMLCVGATRSHFGFESHIQLYVTHDRMTRTTYSLYSSNYSTEHLIRNVFYDDLRHYVAI